MEISSSEYTQKKLYFLCDKLQEMARTLSPNFQMRLPYELLSSLANCLLNDMIFQIVIGLMEIQQVTEKHLYQQRQQVLNQHKLDIHALIEQSTDEQTFSSQYAQILRKQSQEIKILDMNIVEQLDQKVADQQQTLEQAGVPGFYVTKNPTDIKLQMHLLNFILRLSKYKECNNSS